MRRFVISGTVLVFLALLLFFALWPAADPILRVPTFHFYVVTFSTFATTVVAVLLALTLGQTTQPRHTLAAVAFAVIGAIFLLHGLSTRGVLINHLHPAVR